MKLAASWAMPIISVILAGSLSARLASYSACPRGRLHS